MAGRIFGVISYPPLQNNTYVVQVELDIYEYHTVNEINLLSYLGEI